MIYVDIETVIWWLIFDGACTLTVGQRAERPGRYRYWYWSFDIDIDVLYIDMLILQR